MTNYTLRVLLGIVLLSGLAIFTWGQEPRGKKVLMITDMEGVDGVFDSELQCQPWKSPRWEESRKLLTGEVNAAAEGLFQGGATEVVVWDGHDSGHTLSVLDIHPRVRLLTGTPVPFAQPFDKSVSALIFIGQHPMAGAKDGILSHTMSSTGVQNWWANNKAIGEIGTWTMVAGEVGIPTIMLSGDTAACQEYLDLVPNGECAEVKSGVSRTAGYMLSHAAATALIQAKARRAMERLAEIKPYKIAGPVELRIESTTAAVSPHRPRPGVQQIDFRTWSYRAPTFTEALALAIAN
jgi:D-amino peptidase